MDLKTRKLRSASLIAFGLLTGAAYAQTPTPPEAKPAEPAPPAAPETTAAEIGAWARTADLDISNGGRIPVEIREAYHQAHQR